MALYAAHKGYVYQDLVAACFLADALCRRVEQITVDRKSFKGDILDDLTIRTGRHWLRRQVKHSDTKKLELDDLESAVIALNALVKSYVEFHGRDTAQSERVACQKSRDQVCSQQGSGAYGHCYPQLAY